MERFLAEGLGLASIVDPQSIVTAKTGARISAVNSKRVAFLVDVGAGTSTTAHTFVLRQHDAASAGNSYDLNSQHPYYHKIGAATKFTKVDVTVDTSSFNLHALLADAKGLAVLEVLMEDMRSDCKWVSLDILAVGGTQVGAVAAIVSTSFKPAYAQDL